MCMENVTKKMPGLTKNERIGFGYKLFSIRNRRLVNVCVSTNPIKIGKWENKKDFKPTKVELMRMSLIAKGFYTPGFHICETKDGCKALVGGGPVGYVIRKVEYKNAIAIGYNNNYSPTSKKSVIIVANMMRVLPKNQQD